MTDELANHAEHLQRRLEQLQGLHELRGDVQQREDLVRKMLGFVRSFVALESCPQIEGVLETVVRLGWDNVAWTRGYTLLHFVAECLDDPMIVELVGLLANDADQRDDSGLRAIDYARRSSKPGVVRAVETLRRRRPPSDSDLATPRAAEKSPAPCATKGDEGIRLESKWTCQVRGEERRMLEYACDMVVRRGWETIEWQRGFSALHLAGRVGSVVAVEVLLQHGAASGLEARDMDGQRPIDYALALPGARPELLKLLSPTGGATAPSQTLSMADAVRSQMPPHADLMRSATTPSIPGSGKPQVGGAHTLVEQSRGATDGQQRHLTRSASGPLDGWKPQGLTPRDPLRSGTRLQDSGRASVLRPPEPLRRSCPRQDTSVHDTRAVQLGPTSPSSRLAPQPHPLSGAVRPPRMDRSSSCTYLFSRDQTSPAGRSATLSGREPFGRETLGCEPSCQAPLGAWSPPPLTKFPPRDSGREVRREGSGCSLAETQPSLSLPRPGAATTALPSDSLYLGSPNGHEALPRHRRHRVPSTTASLRGNPFESSPRPDTMLQSPNVHAALPRHSRPASTPGRSSYSSTASVTPAERDRWGGHCDSFMDNYDSGPSTATPASPASMPTLLGHAPSRYSWPKAPKIPGFDSTEDLARGSRRPEFGI